ncbi:MAG: tRNA 2-thiouridine(34) synthase MnmA [Anaerolineaceae bacterium]|nr:tRNA 2-thiouridine(34) synthase MnmA [Anaerolineaceae bacterium]
MSNFPTVVVAMSGGVDSSVAAALLVEQGYPVIGMMLRLWSEPGFENENRCCTPDAMAQARKVAAQLGIPFYAVDSRDRFRQQVVETFLEGYRQGLTPNPCMVCNRQIRWGYLMDQARAIGAEYMATGHYARLNRLPGGKVELRCGQDEAKDQSYVLGMLNQDQLTHSLFPIGDYKKPEVRELARRFGLPVAERAESQDLCFLAGQDYRQFLSRIASDVVKPGLIVNQQDEVLGEHHGLAFYTIGQRKGIMISGPIPLYVISKKVSENKLVVGPKEELGLDEMYVADVNWVSGERPENISRVKVKIRYKADFAWASVEVSVNDTIHVRFEKIMRDITPGQIAVFYNNDVVLGAGIIQP